MGDPNDEQREQLVLVPIENRQVDFYGDMIVAFIAHMPNDVLQVFVPIRPLCEYLGLTWASQYNRLKRDEVLRGTIFIMKTVGADGKQRNMVSLPLDMLPGWLFGISTTRVKAELREKMTRYRRECFRVLWEAFRDHIIPPPPVGDGSGMQELQLIVEMGEAIAEMARQQIRFQQEQEHLALRLNKAGYVVKALQDDVTGLQIRIGAIEDKLHPHTYITDEQAANVSTVVKALAEVLTRQTGQNQYQGVFAELYRRFGVSSYKHIRQEMYAHVLAFLDEWYDAAKAGRERQDGE